MRVKTKYPNNPDPVSPVRVSIYTRKSTDDGLEQEFNSIDAQREAVESYVLSQCGRGWVSLSDRYDDGGFSGANTNRPAFQRLLLDIQSEKTDLVAVYRYDRLSRSLLDFLQILRFLDEHNVGFVAVTQNFDTTTSIGRLSLNMVMSFAEFERETIAERTRDKMGATRKRGMWTGGRPILGYDLVDKKLVVSVVEAAQVRAIFQLYLELGSLLAVTTELNHREWKTKTHTTKAGKRIEGHPFDKVSVQRILSSALYPGKVKYEGELFDGAHEAIVDKKTWQAVQTQLESHRGHRDRAKRNKWSVLLMGLVRCHCGSAMTHHYVSKGGKRFHYYVCEKTLKKGAAACLKSRIAMRNLETAVVEKIRTIGENPDLLKETAAALQRTRKEHLPELLTEARQLEKERDRMKSERQEMLHAMEQEEKGAPDEPERLAEINDSLKMASTRLEEVLLDLEALKNHTEHEDGLKTALKVFSPVWDQLFSREKVRILQLLIESVVFNGQDGTVEIRFRLNGIAALANEFEEEARA